MVYRRLKTESASLLPWSPASSWGPGGGRNCLLPPSGRRRRIAKNAYYLSRSPPRWRDLQLPNLCYRSHPRWEIDANVLIGSSGVESVVSNSTNAACVGAHRSSPWGQLNLLLDEWWQRSRSRNELESLDDAMLRDIGLSHREAGFDASKPFWAN
jgi:uncharacterized protein YjiS (DUF1127 family)